MMQPARSRVAPLGPSVGAGRTVARRDWRRWWTSVMAALAVPVAILLVWDGSVRWAGVPKYILPLPVDVAKALWNGLTISPFSEESYYYHGFYTLLEMLVGFGIGTVAGVGLGTAIAEVPLLERYLLPYVVGFKSIPKVALAPLFVIWFGFGLTAKVAVVALLAFFPIAINTLEGLQSVAPEQIQLLRSLRASRWQIFNMVKFPSALPFIFAGLNIGLVQTVTGAIVAEFVGSEVGLGILLLNMNQFMDVAGSFSVILLLACMGVVFNGLIRRIQRRVVFWSSEISEANL